VGVLYGLEGEKVCIIYNQIW